MIRRMTAVMAGLAVFWMSGLAVRAQEAGPEEAPAAVPDTAPEAVAPEAQTTAIELGDGVRLEMVWIAAGRFVRGSSPREPHREADETPQQVTLTSGFWMGRTEVTQAQWERVMGANPAFHEGADRPVEMVSWEDCQAFIRKLNELVPGGGFRLPTEAEWEYACRAGTAGPYAGALDELGWYGKNSGGNTRPAGGKPANARGLHDMHGNVFEWCHDWYGPYPPGSVIDPRGPETGMRRVYRGGSWLSEARFCRSADRAGDDPENRNSYLGLRVVRDAP